MSARLDAWRHASCGKDKHVTMTQERAFGVIVSREEAASIIRGNISLDDFRLLSSPLLVPLLVVAIVAPCHLSLCVQCAREGVQRRQMAV